MNFIKKIFTAFFLAAIILTLPNVTLAEEVTANEIKEYSAVGEYRLGDDDTRASAKIKALDDAKRKIAEQIGVYVQTYSEMNHSELTTDLIRTAAIAMIKVKSEQVEYSENGTLCKVFIVADADINNKNIAEIVEKITRENAPKPDKEILKVAGIREYNGHYYKFFNLSMNWHEANQFCKKLGGHLVTITSKAEQAAIQNFIFYDGKKNYYWTGGFSVEQGRWEWTTREEFTYSNWAEGEPNNDLGNEFILTLQHHTGKWNDCPADGINHIPDVDFFKLENSGVICEWDSFKDIQTEDINS